MLYRLGVPLLAILTALLLGALAMWASGSNPLVAYKGLLDGALLKPRAFGETLVATTPYLLLALGVGFGFKCGLFNIGVEGQYYICLLYTSDAVDERSSVDLGGSRIIKKKT